MEHATPRFNELHSQGNATFDVVLVDDSDKFRYVCEAALKGIPGVRVVGSERDGKAALALIQLVRPDLVILDIHMPDGMSGVEVASRLRLLPYPQPFVFLSLYCGTIYQGIADHLDALAFISKGDFVDRLLPLINDLKQNIASHNPVAKLQPKERKNESQ